MSKGIVFPKLAGRNLKIGIVMARWNAHITENLRSGCEVALAGAGVAKKNIISVEAPGSFELPLIAQHLIKTKKVDAVVVIGCLIKGETMHFEYLSDAVFNGLMRVGLETGKPVIAGVLTCLNEKQAVVRSTGDNNHGYGWGLTAVEMALLTKKK